MKAYIGETPMKIGDTFYYNGVKYKILKIESRKIENSDESVFVFKTKIVEQPNLLND